MATACSNPPRGGARRTLSLARATLMLTEHAGLSRETVCRRLDEAFPACEAHCLLRRLDFDYTRAASILVAIEIGTWSRSRRARAHCLDRRSAERQRVCAIADWERQRNAAGACTKWMFTADCARTKLSRAYPGAQQVLFDWTALEMGRVDYVAASPDWH